MRRLLLILLLAGVASAGAETREAILQFKRDFVPGMSAYTREGAIDRISAMADPDVFDVFVWAVGATQTQVRRAVVEKDRAREDLKILEKQLDDLIMNETERARRKGREPGPISVPAPLMEGIEKGRRDVERLQKEIDEEYRMRDALAAGFGAWVSILEPGDRAKLLAELEKGPLDDRDFTIRAFFVKGLGKVDLPEATRLLLWRLAEEKDRRVRPVVIDSLAEQAGDLAVPDLAALLAAEQWQIRAAAIAALGRIGCPDAVQPLIAALRLEDGRLRGDIGAVLAALTGVDFGILADRWQAWWDANKAGFVPPRDRKADPAPEAEGPADGGRSDAEPPDGPMEAPPAPPPGGKASFYGIEVLSKRILFVIDISNSMNGPAGGARAGKTKVDVAKYELKSAILGLEEDATFNIVFYHHEVFQWRKGMIAAKDKDRGAAAKFVDDMDATGNTNVYDALKLAFHIVGMGARDKNYELGADTIFFLSDGLPNRGDVVDPNQILAEVGRWNELRRVKVHAVGVGADHDANFLRRLAEMSGGIYVAR